MPVTNWKDIKGELCIYCHKPASHFYGCVPVCCQCHGGHLCTAEETAQKNERAMLRIKIATELLGWHKTILSYDRMVDDDGCMFGNRCDVCKEPYGKPHKPDCQHMNTNAVWQKSQEVYADTGDPKHYTYINAWNPLKNPAEALEALRFALDKYNLGAVSRIENRGLYFEIKLYDHGQLVTYASTVENPCIAICEVLVWLVDNKELDEHDE